MGNDEQFEELEDIQKELEAKFEELFGSLDDSKEIKQEGKKTTLSNSIIRQLEEEYDNFTECAADEYGLRNYKEALSLWQQACDIAQQLNDIEKEIHCYYGICQNLYHLGNLKNALLMSFKVMKYYTSAKPFDLYWTVTRQLHIAQELVIPRNYLEKLLKQKNICNKRYQLEKQAADLLDEAYLNIDYCILDKALSKAQRSKILRVGGGSGYNLPSYYRILFLCYYLKGDLKQMEKTMMELQNLETSAKKYKEKNLCFCRYTICYMQGDYENAYTCAKHELILQRKSNVEVYMVLYRLITILAAWGKPQIAREYLVELIEDYRKNRKKDKRYWQRYYTYRGLGHFYACCAKTEKNTKYVLKYFQRSLVCYKHARIVAEQIDYLLCTEGWQQKVDEDIASLERHDLPKPILCER